MGHRLSWHGESTKSLMCGLNRSSAGTTSLSLMCYWIKGALKSWINVVFQVSVSVCYYIIPRCLAGKAKRCLRHSNTSLAAPWPSAPSTCQEPSCRQRPSSETVIHSHLMCLRISSCPTFPVTAHFVPQFLLSPVFPFKVVRINLSCQAKSQWGAA